MPDFNGGFGGPTSQTKYYKENLILSSIEPTRIGYKFSGWSTNKNTGFISYHPGDIYTKDENIVLTAIWELEPDLVLPTSLATVESEAFSGGAFTYTVLPVTTTSIGSKAFANCPNLKHIEIPADEITIAKDAFSGVTDLTIHCHADSDAYWYAQRYGFNVEVIE